MFRSIFLVIAVAVCLKEVVGHGETWLVCSELTPTGSMIMPPARNSIDSELPGDSRCYVYTAVHNSAAWSHGKYPATGTIEPYNCACTNGTDECNTGQSCFWYDM